MDARVAVRSQYRAALAMLEQAVTRCPEPMWNDDADRNRFWRVAYHAAFFTHLYLSDSHKAFVPWNVELARLFIADLARDVDVQPCSREDILAYVSFVRSTVDERVPDLDLAAPSGFDWLKCDKLELQMYNIRHLQHHTGELMERLGSRAGVEVEWAFGGGDRPS